MFAHSIYFDSTRDPIQSAEIKTICASRMGSKSYRDVLRVVTRLPFTQHLFLRDRMVIVPTRYKNTTGGRSGLMEEWGITQDHTLGVFPRVRRAILWCVCAFSWCRQEIGGGGTLNFRQTSKKFCSIKRCVREPLFEGRYNQNLIVVHPVRMHESLHVSSVACVLKSHRCAWCVVVVVVCVCDMYMHSSYVFII